MANLWRRIVEAASIIGCVISAAMVPQPEFKWFLSGVALCALACVFLYEILLTKKERELLELERAAGHVIAERDQTIENLKERIEQLADPELAAIYREDERERLRIDREHIERLTRGDPLLDEWMRKNLGLSR